MQVPLPDGGEVEIFNNELNPPCTLTLPKKGESSRHIHPACQYWEEELRKQHEMPIFMVDPEECHGDPCEHNRCKREGATCHLHDPKHRICSTNGSNHRHTSIHLQSREPTCLTPQEEEEEHGPPAPGITSLIMDQRIKGNHHEYTISLHQLRRLMSEWNDPDDQQLHLEVCMTHQDSMHAHYHGHSPVCYSNLPGHV